MHFSRLIVLTTVLEAIFAHQTVRSSIHSPFEFTASRTINPPDKASARNDHAPIQPAICDWNHRRTFLISCGGITGSVWYNQKVQALDQEITNCLQDLPLKPPNTVRLYLCRHGQTENNRLHIVQGSRVDPPLNSNGILMAERLGLALCKIHEPLECVYHSPLLRAQQTAQIAASQFSKPPRTQVLDDLTELDFGPAAEKQKEPRANALGIYTQWSLGHIDERPPDGESCREVLMRSASALNSIVRMTTNQPKTHFPWNVEDVSYRMGSGGGHVAAITHSAFLRLLVALVSDKSLFQTVTTQQQVNANINVIDLDTQVMDTRDSTSGIFSHAPEDFSLVIPRSKVLRINEIRHLEGLPR